MIPHVNQLLLAMLRSQEKISDLFFFVGRPPQVESNGKLQPVNIKGLERLSPYHVDVIAHILMGGSRDSVQRFVEKGATDFSYTIPGFSRFRVNVYQQRGTLAIVMRVIPFTIPSMKELGLPEALYKIIDEQNGIVLVTGPTGSGKSTTIAAILNEINERHAYHIVTIEDPIEYMYRHKSSSICQRELGVDTTSFSDGLRSALRQTPKVIVVGEMRDRETAEIALEAAETGHLIFSTLHTIDAVRTINRIIGMFPQHDETQVRNRFANTFRYIISQKLVRKKGGGRIPVFEILRSTLRTKEYIIKGESEGRSLIDAMNDAGMDGMQTFDRDLERLVQNGLLEKEVALMHATSATNLELAFQSLPEDEVPVEAWERLLMKEDLTPEEILKIPDFVTKLGDEINEDDLDHVVQGMMDLFSTDKTEEKLSFIRSLPALITGMSKRERWKNLEAELGMKLSRVAQDHNDPTVMPLLMNYLQQSFTKNFTANKLGYCEGILAALGPVIESQDAWKKIFSQGIEGAEEVLKTAIVAGGKGSDIAVTYLRLSGPKGAEFIFNKLVEEQDRAVRIRLLTYIERFSAVDIANQIGKRLSDYRWYVVRNMITIMTKVSIKGASELLRQAAAHEEPRVAKEILKKLFVSTTPQDTETILMLLNHPNKSVKIQTANLSGMSAIAETIPVLMELLASSTNSDADLRAACLQALTKLKARQGLPQAMASLKKKAVSNEDLAERTAAIRMMGEIGGESARPLLAKIAEAEKNPETRALAQSYCQ